MNRKTEYIARRDWDRIVGDLDGDLQEQMRAELLSRKDGDKCEYIEYTISVTGRIDSQSSPRPAGTEQADKLALALWHEQIECGIGEPGETVDPSRLHEWWSNRILPCEDYLAAAAGDTGALSRVRDEAGL